MKRRILPESEDRLLMRQRFAKARRRLTLSIGFVTLLLGYASLAVSPDTPQEWVLIRVGIGFALLFTGFVVAVQPWLSHLFGDTDD